MSELLSTLGSLISSLGNVQSAAVLKEHVALLRSKLEFIQDRVIALEAENARLIGRNAELEQEAVRQAASAQFVESRGALFKRLAGGEYSETPYCPVCHSAMWAFESMFPFECGNQSCKRIAGFKGGELKEVLSRLPP